MVILMNIHGIIAEYNPFHNGHQFLIEQCREQGASHIVVAMSGNFVQRGEPALLDKWTRAKSALLCGADLIVEIPLVWSLSSAEGFARGGVEILNGLGCVTSLSFGSECAKLSDLQALEQAIRMPKTDERIKHYLKDFVSYPSARQKAVADVCGKEIASLLESPNDILGVEYIKAINEINSQIKPNPIKRTGPNHDAEDSYKEFLSATQIRKQLMNGEYRCFDYVPPQVADLINMQMGLGKAPVSIKEIETSILSKLRVMDVETIKNAPDVSEGLENRIASCVKQSMSVEDLYGRIKTKRYTYSRIRRIIMSLFLGVKASDFTPDPPYIRVLGFNDKGQEILKSAKKTSTLPIIMKSSQIKSLDDYAQKIFALECSSTDIYTLAMPTPLPCGMEMTENVVII